MPLTRLWREISHRHPSDTWGHTGLIVADPAHVLPVTAPTYHLCLRPARDSAVRPLHPDAWFELWKAVQRPVGQKCQPGRKRGTTRHDTTGIGARYPDRHTGSLVGRNSIRGAELDQETCHL